MKKLVAFVAVAVATVAVAVADPLLVVHGNFNFLNLGSSWGKDIKDIKDIKKTYLEDEGKDNFNYSVGGGVGINIPFGGYFGFQPGVDFYYNTVGYNGKRKVLGTEVESSYSYLSLEIPLLLTMKYNKFNFALGPYAAFQLGAKGTSKEGNTTTTGSIDDVSIFNIGLEARVGYEERIGMGMVVASVGYKLDFLPIKADDKDMFTRRGLTVDVGYKIPLSIFGL